MEKISVIISVPALGGKFDFIIPLNMQVRDVINLVMRILSVEYGVSESTMDLSLFDTQDTTLLQSNYTMGELGVKDGAKLILL